MPTAVTFSLTHAWLALSPLLYHFLTLLLAFLELPPTPVSGFSFGRNKSKTMEYLSYLLLCSQYLAQCLKPRISSVITCYLNAWLTKWFIAPASPFYFEGMSGTASGALVTGRREEKRKIGNYSWFWVVLGPRISIGTGYGNHSKDTPSPFPELNSMWTL